MEERGERKAGGGEGRQARPQGSLQGRPPGTWLVSDTQERARGKVTKNGEKGEQRVTRIFTDDVTRGVEAMPSTTKIGL